MISPNATRSPEIVANTVTGTRAARSRRARLAVGVAAAAAGAALALTGCSSGQVTQTSSQVAAVNGANVDSGHLMLRNVHVIFPEGDSLYSIVPGGSAELSFTIVNNNPAEDETLLRITSNEATIRISPQVIPAGGKLVAGIPVGQLVLEEAVDEEVAPTSEEAPEDPTTTEAPAGEEEPTGGLTVVLTDLGDGVTTGLNFPLVFEFENGGKVEVSVPVDPGAQLERDPAAQIETHVPH